MQSFSLRACLPCPHALFQRAFVSFPLSLLQRAFLPRPPHYFCLLLAAPILVVRRVFLSGPLSARPGTVELSDFFPGADWPKPAGSSDAGGAVAHARRIRRERNFGERPVDVPLGMAALTRGSNKAHRLASLDKACTCAALNERGGQRYTPP
jgi:hypothetical protein